MKRIPLLLTALTVAIVVSSCNNKTNESATDNRSVYRAAVETVFKAFETGNTDALDSVIAADYVDHSAPAGYSGKGVEDAKRMIKLNHQSFPDTKMTIRDIAIDGDLVMVHYNWKGTNTGEAPGFPATGRTADASGVEILKFANGKITEHWGYYEEMKMMQQMGMMPQPVKQDTTAKQ